MFLKNKFQTLDGRWLIILGLTVYFSILGFSEVWFGTYEKTWQWLGVPARRYFIDLQVLLCGIEEFLQGHNPYTWIKCTYNYPLLWVVFSYIPYFSLAYLYQIAIVLIFLFFTGVLLFIKKTSWRNSLIYSALLLSPSVMLALERGNNDVIIFLLIGVSLIFNAKDSKKISYAFLLFSTFLKLYPIVAFVYVLEHVKTKKVLFLLGFGVVLLFVAYLIVIQEQLKPIYKIHPREAFLSYGIYTLPFRIYSKVTFFSLETLKTAALLVALLGCSYFVIAQMRSTQTKNLYPAEPIFFNGYLIGSAIFVSTFMAGNNFDYRFIFLIFTFPQLFNWSKITDFRRVALIQLSMMGFILWTPFLLEQSTHLYPASIVISLIKEILCWTLFFVQVKFLVLYVFQRVRLLT